MKTKLKVALATIAVCGTVGVVLAATEQSAAEARAKLELLAKVTKDKGLNAFNFLNGPGEEVGRSKHRTTEDTIEAAGLKGSNIVCFQDGKYAVHQLHPTKVGKDALAGPDAFTDANGSNVAQKAINGLRTSSDGTYSAPVIIKIDGVRDEKTGQPLEEERYFLTVSSKFLLGAKNDTGKKFFCGVMYSAPSKVTPAA